MEDRWVLSTGKVTSQIEYYILDIFKLYLTVFPGDIPGMSRLGIDFNLGATRKTDIPGKVRQVVNELAQKISDRIRTGATLEVESVEIVSETRVRVVINVNRVVSDEVYIDLYSEPIN